MINPKRLVRDVFCIGASAGGLHAVSGILARLPADLPAVVAIVMHRSPTFDSQLARLLAHKTALPVMEPAEDDPIVAGHIYVAPRDVHLIVEANRWQLVRGAKLHWTRPAVDPLFVSAADVFGPRCVGILLSGGGADGVAGLIAIKARGGLSIVQDPAEAQDPSMPIRAIHEDDTDAIMKTDEIAAAMAALAVGAPFSSSPVESGSENLIPIDC
ncbi:MAG TPA: chemotaxis protein CheB [Methylomirabilota bacterium]|nr:chemotaxis protein CheB [Methylomirabilota bacterium]